MDIKTFQLVCCCLFIINILQTHAQQPIQDFCQAQYTEGSLTKPCGFCGVCTKTRRDDLSSFDECFDHRKLYKKLTLKPAIVFPVKTPSSDYCTLRDFCKKVNNFKVDEKDIDCRCLESRGCVSMLGTCKCACDEGKYGQQCEFPLPSGTSLQSFADVRNVVFNPYVYVNDFATISLYFYNTGTNLLVEIQTQHQLLMFDAEECEWNSQSVVNNCADIFKDSELHNYVDVCHGGPTYENRADKDTCVINVNIAFSREQSDVTNKQFYIMDDKEDTEEYFLKQNIAAKVELVKVIVKNSITNFADTTVHLDKFGLIVIYSGKYSFEDCLPFVKIPKFSNSMQHASHFPRKVSITVSNLVVLNDTLNCSNLGAPIVNWYVWVIEKNHDEKKSVPYYQLLGAEMLLFEPFSLDFGMYKVKSEIKFVDRKFNRGITYCYFKIVPIPLQPLIIGGSLRYIYYNSNLKLETMKSSNPNFPEDQQPTLKYTWQCNDTSTSLCDEVITEEIALIKHAPFIPGKEYTFSMKTTNPSTLQVEITSQIIVVSSDPMPSLVIKCFKNCGGEGYKSDFREIFYFQVIHSVFSYNVNRKESYFWTFAENNQTFHDVSDIQQKEETPSSVLIVNENSLNNDEIYTFEVVGGGDIPGKAQIKVKTFKDSKEFHCEINPKSGTAGVTKFHIFCSDANFEEGDVSVLYYFYDKSSKEDLTGRLLATSHIHTVEELILTRGTVAIYAVNTFGHFLETYVNVILTYQTVTPKMLETNIDMMKTYSENEGYEQKISFISSFCDLLNDNSLLKETVIEQLLEEVSKEEVLDIVQVEILLLSTQSIICNKDECKTALESDTSYKYLSEVLKKISYKLASEIEQNTNRVFSSLKINLLYSSLIKCMAVLLSQNEKMTKNKQFEQIDFKRYNLFKFGNLEAIWSLERVNRALAVVSLPYVKHWAVQTEFIETWMKTDHPSFFTSGTKGNYKGSYISLSPELENNLKKKSNLLTVHLMKFDINPVWFSLTDDVTTEVCLISFGIYDENKTYTPVTHFKYPVDIFLKKKPVSQSSIFGKVAQPDPKGDPDTNDFSVAVNRLFPKRGETISIRFLNLNDIDSFRVLIMINSRPDYDQLVEKGVLIKKKNISYTYNKVVQGDKDTVYIGIIPGPDIPVGNVVEYEFELEAQRCDYWYDYLWSTAGCSLGPGSTEEYFHCQCNHLSAVAGFLTVPVNTIDPLQDYSLFLTIPDNPYVFSIVVLILLIYIILFIWSVKRDKVDMVKRNILVLEDNISTDCYGYLLTVVTGSKCFAGTSSSIGIILHGSDTSSRSHILKSTLRRTLQRSDDWFLMFTPKPLGIISSIQLWTNHSGPNPNWFCDTIYIHDLSNEKDYTFIIGKWFGITELGTRFESFARPVKFEKEAHFTEFTIINIISGLREFHLWMSIFMHHPRSPIYRSQRLSIAFVALITILLASILFYDGSLPEDEDLPSYNITSREIMISIYSLLISMVITEINYLLFKKGFTSGNYNTLKTYASAQQEQMVGGTRMVVDCSADKLKVSKLSKRDCSYYLKRLISALRKHKFYPVKISTNPGSKKMCTTFSEAFAWTICFSTISVASFFIVWIGLKLGKVKSWMWLTSITMAFGQDFFLADPIKICIIALVFGMIQTQLCDVFSYDPKIYKIRTKSNVKQKLKRDNYIHRMRFESVYKHIPFARQELLKDRLRKVKQWWVLVDTVDIVFSSVLMFVLILQAVSKSYYQTNTTIKQFLFKNINLGKNSVPSPEIQGIESFYDYLQDRIFSEIHRTHWYNKNLLTSPEEILPETGWFGTLTNRLMGVPRLRQIRVVRKDCDLPNSFAYRSHMFCNVPLSTSTEDDDDYGERWKYASWSDILFEESPWSYLSPNKSSSISMFSESRQLFHGGGYVAELKRTRRESQSAVLNLLDSNWLDLRTRIVFFEITVYNVNKGILSSIVFTTEHLQSTLILPGGGTWSTIIYEQDILLEALFVMYAVLSLFKLSMQIKTVGAGMFFQSFWTVYDLLFVVVGVIVFMIFRIFSKMALTFIHEFQTEEKDDFGHFETMIFNLHLKRFSLGILFVMAIIRTLRLTKYGNTRIFAQLMNTINYSYPEIVSLALVLILFMFILQWMISYLMNILYLTGFSHLLLRKMEYPSIYSSVTSQESVNFIFLPCFISSFSVAFIIVILLKNYTWAKTACKRF